MKLHIKLIHKQDLLYIQCGTTAGVQQNASFDLPIQETSSINTVVQRKVFFFLPNGNCLLSIILIKCSVSFVFVI